MDVRDVTPDTTCLADKWKHDQPLYQNAVPDLSLTNTSFISTDGSRCGLSHLPD